MIHFRTTWIAILVATWKCCQGQNCFGGIESFEKTTGTSFGPTVSTSVLLQQQDQALTRDCINLCKQQSQCLAFSLDYAGFRCGAYSVNSVGRRDVLETRLNSNFFEKTCFHGVQKTHFENLCGDRLWAFERVKDAFLNGYVEKETQNVQTKEECERLCLTELSFICRSADYDEMMRVCRMSKEDRRSQPQAFREVPGSNRDYLENQCAASAPTSCRYDIRPGLSVISMDSLQFASSSDDCQIQCDSETSFNCRAFTYTSNRCFLSGDDSVSLGPVVLPEKPGSTYGEKKCVIEQCTGGAFTYEKMTGFILRSAVQNSIMVSNPGSLGNTLECQEFCQRDGLDCPAFSVNYQNMRCDKLDRNSQGRTQDLVPRDGENYFEKICLRGPVATSCKHKAWAFERVLGHELEGQLYDRNVPFVQSRRDCEELCLEERSFICRSALYNDDTTECKLSREDRRTLPTFYRRTNNMRINYLENQCLPVMVSCQYEETQDSYPTYTDHIQMMGITSNEVCEQFCTNYKSFNCRSYAYYSSNGQCFLSGDDRASGSSGAVQGRPGLMYNERKCPALTPPTETPTTPTTEPPPPSRQCSQGEIMMLEKLTGYQHLGTVSVLYRGNPEIPGITSECRRMCELNYECRGFTLDYLKQECYSGVETSSTKPKELVPAENKAYFEGVCLPFYLGCPKQWMFDRYMDKELRGVQARDVIRLVSRTDCERRCLEERRFVCRSANYYRYNQECRLYAEERTIPHTQLTYAGGVDYLENQCNVGTATCPFKLPERDMFMVYTTKAIPAISNFELCHQLCAREVDFNCRSYTYLEQGGLNDLCLLSSESRQTGQGAAVRYRHRALYEETECRGQIPGTTTPRPPTIPTPVTPTPSSGTPMTPPTPPPPPARCSIDQYTYEKLIGHTVRFGRKERVPTRTLVGVLGECQSHCHRLGDRCRGFIIEYSKYKQLCYWLDAYSSGIDNTIMPAPDTAYFEKICLSRTCGKMWTFERVPGYTFQEIPDLEIPGVPRRSDCEDICVRHSHPCKAAIYDSFRRICRLFTETRRSRPGAFVRDVPEMEYLENNCAVDPASCDYRAMPDRFFPFIDKLTRAYSLSDCQRQCDLEDKFVCRSLNYETLVRDCALSSEDMISIPMGHETLMPRPNSVYSEKGDCEQVTVQCNQQDMLLTVNFGAAFHGRVYAKGNPTQCYMIGTGQTALLFAISLGNRCGTVLESPGRYANEVVIQEHPVIVTNSDKTIKVLCSFETMDRTVTLGALFPGASPGVDVTTRFQVPITAIVTNTAPPPNVAMRVLDRSGRDAGVVGLGDDLMLRIELKDPATSLAIFARNLYARSKNGESLFLIDSTGCPTDPTIFPALSLDARDRKSLFANFKAFRFPSTGLVNFEVQIRFCQDQCKPVRCANNMESFGRKKRSVVDQIFQPQANITFSNTPRHHLGYNYYYHTLENSSSSSIADDSTSQYNTNDPLQRFSFSSSINPFQNSEPSTTSPSSHVANSTDHQRGDFNSLQPASPDHGTVGIQQETWKIHHPRNPQFPSPQQQNYFSDPGVVRNEYYTRNPDKPAIHLPMPPERPRMNSEDYSNAYSRLANSWFQTMQNRHLSNPMVNPPPEMLMNLPPQYRNSPFYSMMNRTAFDANLLPGQFTSRLSNVQDRTNLHTANNFSNPISLQESTKNVPYQYRSPQHYAMNRTVFHANADLSSFSARTSHERDFKSSHVSPMNPMMRPNVPEVVPSQHMRPPHAQIPQHRPSYQSNARHNGNVANRTMQTTDPRQTRGSHAHSSYGHVSNVADVPTPGPVVTPELIVSTMVPVPDEVPLSLAIMVGEDSSLNINAWNQNEGDAKPTESDASETLGLVCTTVATIVATAVALSLAHVGGVVGVFCCYRWHRKNKRKKMMMQDTLSMPRPRHSHLARRLSGSTRQDEVFYAKPDVSFRNVYGAYTAPSER